jgi:putative hydrolase of the HAD superfamily
MSRMPKLNGYAPIKAVLFDLGKVILHFDFKPAFRRLSKVCSLTPREIDAFFSRSGLEVLYDGGKITSAQFYRQVKKALRHRLSYPEFKAVWNDVFTPNRPMIQLIRKLKGKYRLVLISNTNAMHYKHIRSTYSFLRYFDGVVLSFRQKIRKPDARIYRAALKACRARPHEIFYIDDRPDLTKSAQELGIRAFTFKDNPQALAKTMKKLQIRL